MNIKTKILICLVLAIVVGSIISTINWALPGKHSSTLQKTTTKTSTTICYEYYDSSGNLTVASDLGYATVIKNLDKSGHTVLESYYDAQGNPAKSSNGAYAVSTEWSGARNVLTTYLGESDQPTKTTSGYAYIARDFNDANQVICEHYFDVSGNPTANTSGYAAVAKEYNSAKQVIRESYLDTSGNPVTNTSGYAAVTKEYDSKGHVSLEHYLDTNGNPCSNTQNEWGKAYEYNAAGKQIKVVSLGEDGYPTTNGQGYSWVTKTYFDNGSVDTETYYDVEGNPVHLSSGQYAIAHRDGQTIKLDANGNEIFEPNTQFAHYPWLTVVIGFFLALIGALLPRKGKILFLFLCVALVAYETLLLRTVGSIQLKLIPLQSWSHFLSEYSTRVNIIENIWLFIPFGATLYGLVSSNTRRQAWIVVLVGAFALSLCVESMQLVFVLGTFEVDDLINNTLGGAIGALIAFCASKLRASRQRCYKKNI